MTSTIKKRRLSWSIGAGVAVGVISCLTLLFYWLKEPQWTDIEVGYTKARYADVLVHRWEFVHSLVIAKNPNVELHDYYTRAGPVESGFMGSSKSSSSGSYRCRKETQICAISENLTNQSQDKLREIVHRQKVGRVNLPFSEVKRRMHEAAKKLNGMERDYIYDERNSNTYAFTFLKNWLGIRDAWPDVNGKIPGATAAVIAWDEESLEGFTR